jgi:hypothetical protein
MLQSKKILASFLLLLLATPLFFFIGYLVKREIVCHEMMEKLESASLHTITLDLAEVNWIKANKEVMIEGKLFDVKNSEIINNKIKLTGLFDYEETKLEKDFTDTFHTNQNQSSPFNPLKLKFIFNLYFKEALSSISLSIFQNKERYPIFNEVAVTQIASITSPPPNF